MGGLKLEVEVDYNGWVSAGVHNAILDQNIDCANLNPEPSAHSGSWVHKGLGAQYPQSTLEYNLATAIEVWLLTQPVTCGMVSVVFVAMSRLKVASTTSASLPIIPSTERTNGEKKYVGRIKPSHVCLYWLFPSDTTIYTFPLVSKYRLQHLQTWRQWSPLYGFSVRPVLTRHPVFLEVSLCESTPHRIFCVPSGLGFCLICSEGKSLVSQGGWSHQVSRFDVRCRDLRLGISAHDTPKRFACNCSFFFGGYGG